MHQHGEAVADGARDEQGDHRIFLDVAAHGVAPAAQIGRATLVRIAGVIAGPVIGVAGIVAGAFSFAAGISHRAGAEYRASGIVAATIFATQLGETGRDEPGRTGRILSINNTAPHCLARGGMGFGIWAGSFTPPREWRERHAE